MRQTHSFLFVALAVLTFHLPAWGAVDAPVAGAAQRGDLESVRHLLRDGADVNAAQGDGMTALHWAADRGDAELAAVLIYAGGNVAAGTRIGSYTPLHIAARRGHAEVARVLLAAGSDPNAATTNSGATPLHLAAAAGRPEIVMSLLDAGAGVDIRETAWGQTPLVFAAAGNRTGVIRVLLDAGADVSATSSWVDTAEREEADRAAERQIREMLAGFKEQEGGGTDWKPSPSEVQAALDASREIQRNWTEIKQAAEEKAAQEKAAKEEAAREKAAKEAEGQPGKVEEGQDPDGAQRAPQQMRRQRRPATDDEGAKAQQPVVFDADGNPVDTTPNRPGQQRSLSYGQMVGGWGGLTPLLHAVRQGHREATLMLLEAGADIDQPSAGDQTAPLMMAAVNGQWDLALTLIERGANPNLASNVGATPLYAVLERTWAPRASFSHPTEHEQQKATHLEVLEALLKAGADPNVRLQAHLWYMEYTFGVLRQSGINVKGATPFWRAAYALDVDALRLLKQYGADPNIATMKPPERRRRPQGQPQQKSDEPVEGETSGVSDKTAKTEESKAQPGDEQAKTGAKSNPEGETADQNRRSDPEEDPSGVPPVPVGGPAIAPIHAAAGVGYGQSFAGNAHRHVPDGWLAAVRFLVEECGADVNLRDANAYTPLHHAASRGDNEMILYLVEKGADVTAVSRKGQTTADMANGPVQRVRPFPETIKLLEELGSKNNNNCVSC